MNRQLQHGDVLISQIDRLPKGAHPVERKRGRIIVAEGEATGHHHAIADAGATLLELNGQLYLDVTAEAVTISHEEHKSLTIPTGTYHVGRVKEYDYLSEMERRVVD